MSDQPDEKSNSQPFRDMAERIDLNKDQGFSGAACIIPPGDGKRVQLLLLRNDEDPAAFWSLVKTQAEIAIQEAMNEENSNGWPGRR